MSLEATKRAWTARGLTFAERVILLDVADRANREGYCWASLDEIMERTEVGRTAAYAALRNLKARGHLNEGWTPGSRTAPAFVRNPDSDTNRPESGIRNPDSELAVPEFGLSVSDFGLHNNVEPPKDPQRPPSKNLAGLGDDDPVAVWLALERGSGGPAALGLRSNLGRLQPLWLEDNKAILWARNWAELRKSSKPPTIADMEKLGRWIAAGGAGDFAGTPSQVLTKGGNVANIDVWLGKSERWDGKSDPRAKSPPAAAAPRPPAPQIADWRRRAMSGEGDAGHEDHPSE